MPPRHNDSQDSDVYKKSSHKISSKLRKIVNQLETYVMYCRIVRIRGCGAHRVFVMRIVSLSN